MRDPEGSKAAARPTPWVWALITAGAFLILAMVYGVAWWLARPSNVGQYGSLGDAFAPLTLLASSFGLIAALVSIDYQRREMIDSRAELRRTAAAQRLTVLSALLEQDAGALANAELFYQQAFRAHQYLAGVAASPRTNDNVKDLLPKTYVLILPSPATLGSREHQEASQALLAELQRYRRDVLRMFEVGEVKTGGDVECSLRLEGLRESISRTSRLLGADRERLRHEAETLRHVDE